MVVLTILLFVYLVVAIMSFGIGLCVPAKNHKVRFFASLIVAVVWPYLAVEAFIQDYRDRRSTGK